MRFVSRFGGFGVQVRRQITETYATGGTRIVQPGIHAYFKVEECRPEEIDLARDYWRSWNGFLQQQDEVTIVPPDYRIGAFDSEKAQIENEWDDETRELVEANLTDHAARFNDIMVVPATLVPAPWPNYDSFDGSLAALMRKVVDDGYALEDVLAYERGTQKRPEVIDALEELIATDEIPLEEEVVG